MKRTLYFPLLLSMLLSSCELYMDELEVPDSYEEGADPTEEVVTEDYNGAKVSYQYTESTVELTEQYDQYIVANQQDSILYYREDTPNSFLPKPGEILVSKMREKYPGGLARKVTEVKKENGMFTVMTEQPYYTEVFNTFDLDLTEMDYPTIHYVNYAEETAPIIRMPGASRAEDDKINIDGVQFTRVGIWEIFFSGSSKYDFSKKFSGSIDGELKLTVEEYEAVLKDELAILDGTMKKHSISIIKYTLEGDAHINGTITWKPFEYISDKEAAASVTAGAGVVGPVFYADATITLSAGLGIKGKYTETYVYETKANVENFSFSKTSGMKKITDKYGAGTTNELKMDGFIELKFDLNARFGVGAVGGIIEAGVYGNFTTAISFHFEDDENCHALIAPKDDEEEDVRAYKPRANDYMGFHLELTDVGQYYRMGLPYAARSEFSTLMQNFARHNSFNFDIQDVVKLELRGEKGEGFVFINYLELAKMILNFRIGIKKKYPFFPVLNTKKTYLSCTNDNDFDRNYNHIKGKINFEDDGIDDYEGLEILIYDNEDNYLMRYVNPGWHWILPNWVYEIDVKVPRYSNYSGEWDYYKIYPCYKTHADDNSGLNPGEKEWNFYCDRPIIVKNYRPCVEMSKTHQNAFYKEFDYDIGEDAYLYNVRTYAHIQSSPEVQDWGLMVFLDEFKVSITESNMKNCIKVGEYLFQPDSNGKREYLNDESVSSIDLEIRSNNHTVDGCWAYIVPFYKKAGQDAVVINYKDGVRLQLKDDETLNDRYESELAELADQILVF